MQQKTYTLSDIAAHVDGTVDGDSNIQVKLVAPIDQARPGAIAFIADPSYDHWLATADCAAVLVRKDSPSSDRLALVRVKNPYLAFVRVARELFRIGEPAQTGIHPSAVIAEPDKLPDDISIGAHTVVEAGVQIGAGSIIRNQSTIEAGTVMGERCQIGNQVTIHKGCKIGDDVIIQAGAVIGSDGFGYAREGHTYFKIPHVGHVVLEDRVEIGANCTIDRGTFGITRICAGAKLDNLIHIAHNVEVGPDTVIAAQTGVSGSTKIGARVTIAGQVGFVGHISIGDESIFGAQAGVTKSIPAGITVSGYPAKPHLQARREEAALRRAPEMLKRLRRIEKQLSPSKNKKS